MLTPFPDLLWLSFFAPTIVRVAAGLLFVYAGYICWQRRDAVAVTPFPVVGAAGWVAWLAVLFYFLIGAMLVFGYYTQVAAILGAIGAIKGLVLGGRYRIVFLYPPSTYLLILAICLSLLVSGAGAYAFDLPL